MTNRPCSIEVDRVAGEIVDCAFKLHSRLGPGLLESVYEVILARDLERRGLQVERQRVMHVTFEDLEFARAFSVDLFVNRMVVVELKSVEHFNPVHAKQLLTYLRLLQLPVGLLINFGASTLKAGLKRVVNRHDDAAFMATRADGAGR